MIVEIESRKIMVEETPMVKRKYKRKQKEESIGMTREQMEMMFKTAAPLKEVQY